MSTFLKVFDGSIECVLQREFRNYTDDGLSADVGNLIVPLQNKDGEPVVLGDRKHKKKSVYLPISRVCSSNPAPVVTIKVSSPDGRAGIHLTASRRAEWVPPSMNATEVSLSLFAEGSLIVKSTDTYDLDRIGINGATKAFAKKVVNNLYRGIFSINQLPVNDDVNLFAMVVESCADNMVTWLLDPL